MSGVEKRPIEAVRLGERVLGRNPLREQVKECQEPNPLTWRKIDLEMRKSNGRRLDAALLRELSWLEEHQAQVRGQVWLDLPEMGAQGWATVMAINPCPEIVPGEGSVVTGTFRHEPDDNLLDVRVEGLADPISCTDNHPFWSEDRREFVPAGKLRGGERVQTAALGVVAVMSVAPRAREPWVYNLEVQGEHVYQVSEAGVLVHNSYGGTPPLRPLHPDSSLSPATLQGLSRKSTRELIDSLRPGQREALRVRPDGTMINSHHRIKILRDRGVDVNALPREIIPRDTSAFPDLPD